MVSWGLYSPFDYIKFYCIDLNEFVQLSVTYPTDSLKEEAADYRTLPQDWEFLLEDGGLIEVLRKLSPRQQEVVWLLVAGWTQKEIADQLGLTPAAVSQTKNRAYQQIRKLYRKG